ncbi:MAG: NAD(P)H-dependent oxidoreductase [Burkholderiales bacterium]|nr:MAG: NAD(P)H-dependent oxidoreductase [Burkholderiales bacterium]
MTGGTHQLAQAASAGAATEAAVEVDLRRCDRAGPEHVLAASCYLFATPENLASMAGLMKDFFDRCYYPVLERVVGRPYATLICAGSDGAGAQRQIDRIASGWRLRRVAEPLIVCTHAQTREAIEAPKRIAPAELARARELGAALAAGTALGLW